MDITGLPVRLWLRAQATVEKIVKRWRKLTLNGTRGVAISAKTKLWLTVTALFVIAINSLAILLKGETPYGNIGVVCWATTYLVLLWTCVPTKPSLSKWNIHEYKGRT